MGSQSLQLLTLSESGCLTLLKCLLLISRTTSCGGLCKSTRARTGRRLVRTALRLGSRGSMAASCKQHSNFVPPNRMHRRMHVQLSRSGRPCQQPKQGTQSIMEVQCLVRGTFAVPFTIQRPNLLDLGEQCLSWAVMGGIILSCSHVFPRSHGRAVLAQVAESAQPGPGQGPLD